MIPHLGESGVVDIDQSALDEVLEQLLSNSIRYSSSPAQIKLCTVAKQDHVELHWHDGGPGIHSQHLHQIFNRFTRLEEHRDSSRSDGAGLGLTICQYLMKKMAGSISLEDNCAQIAGSVFILSWPQSASR